MRIFKRFTILMLLVSLLVGCSSGRSGVRSSSSVKPAEMAESAPSEEAVSEEEVEPEETVPVEEAEPEEAASEEEAETGDEAVIDEDGYYYSRDEVALYIHTYGKLPSNFITKKEAKALGWEGGSVEVYAPGKSIGGSSFGNYEGNLPDKKGRKYFECDIDTLGKDSRGPKRLVYSNDGLIYYTGDHYETFELLYGEE